MKRDTEKIDFAAIPNPTRLHSGHVKVPGLTPGAEEVDRLLYEASKTWTVFSYKVSSPCLWVIFLGGTGTGKSTLFNAFVGKPLSRTGMERPITAGPVVYAHQECPIEQRFPFEGMEATRLEAEDPDLEPATGMPGHLLILEHHRTEWSHLVLVDTPDVDSVEDAHRRVAEDLYCLSDAVVFITSQEKYADEVPYRFLSKVFHDHKLYYVVLNKAETRAKKEDLIKTVQSEDMPIAAEKVWLIPYAPAKPLTWFSKHQAFEDLRLALLHDLSKDNLDDLHHAAITSLAHNLDQSIAELLARIRQENEAAQHWSSKLEALTRQIIDDFLQANRQRFAQRAQEHLGVEVRRLFARYDVLARPRRLIKELVLTPFRVLGLARNREPRSREEALQRARQNMDLTPLQEAVMKLNRLVLETLSPQEKTAPLFKALRQPGVALSDEEIKTLILKEQDRLGSWLTERFENLAKDIPAGRKWGIYTTSILWGVLILSFEVAVGGGFTVLDAALDSALAPFVTKGAVELFAYQEVRRLARELAESYREGLLSVLHCQQDRYQDCLRALITSEETTQELERLHHWISNISPSKGS
jgi:GTPase SAR1 family protein